MSQPFQALTLHCLFFSTPSQSSINFLRTDSPTKWVEIHFPIAKRKSQEYQMRKFTEGELS